MAKKRDIQVPSHLISIRLTRGPSRCFSQVFNHCSALPLPSSASAGVIALQGNQEVA